VSPLQFLSPVGFPTPAQIRTAYGIDSLVTSGNAGQGQTVAIVDAFDAPNFVNSTDPNFNNSDLHKFDQEFGLPDPPSFQKVNQFGQPGPLPPTDPTGPGNPHDFEMETSLDVEWVHSIAPEANIILVEANSKRLLKNHVFFVN
jgi:subtilase family serine protease